MSNTKLEKMVDDYNKNGFYIIKNLIDKTTIENIFNDISELIDVVLDNIEAYSVKDLSLDKKYLYLAKNKPILKSHAYDMIAKLGSVIKILTNDKINTIGKILFKTPFVVDHYHIRIDDGGNERLLPLHQELGQISASNFTLWSPLVNISENVGGLRLIPGSHKNGRVKHQFFPEMNNYHGICKDLFSYDDCVSIEMNAGDGVIFHPFLFHGSIPNKSNTIRWTLVSRYNELSEAKYLSEENSKIHMPQHIPEIDDITKY